MTTLGEQGLPENTDNRERPEDPVQDVSQDPEVDYSVEPEEVL